MRCPGNTALLAGCKQRTSVPSMLAVDLVDRERLASVFRRNAPAHAYELGDLDDFDWPHTVWFGWESEARLEEVALLYTQPRIPVLIAIAAPPVTTMAELLTAITWSLPSVMYTHASPGLLETLAERYSVDASAPENLNGLTGRQTGRGKSSDGELEEIIQQVLE